MRDRRRAVQLADSSLPAGSCTFFFKNTDMWNARVGANTQPADATDFKKIITELNDPNNGVWGMGAVVTGIGAANMGVLGVRHDVWRAECLGHG